MAVVSSIGGYSTPQQLAEFKSRQSAAGTNPNMMYASGGGGPGSIDYSPFTSAIPTALGYGDSVMGLGLDPQNKYYDRQVGRFTDQMRAGLAARGLNMSPVGQGLEQEGLGNFNIDWQNTLLDRASKVAGAYGVLGGTAADFGRVGLQGAQQSFSNSRQLGLDQYRAPDMSGMYSDYGDFGSGGNYATSGPDLFAGYHEAPTGWSSAGGDYFAPGTSGYNPNFNWGAQQPPNPYAGY